MASSTYNPQLAPLEVNAATGEPFLRIEGYDDIIITPPRWDDGPQIIPHLNDPRVWQWMQGPPVPYLPSDAESWLNHVKPLSDEVLEELEAAKDSAELITVGHCPVSMIRKVNEDGSEEQIGSIDIIRSHDCGEVVKSQEDPNTYVVDLTRKEGNEGRNRERNIGDPDIIWEFGDYLAPAFHSRGIMTAAVRTVMQKWALPRMNVRIMRAGTFAGNIGSGKVFLKNGFRHIITLPDHAVVRGESKTLDLYEWEAPESTATGS
ncbi:hypothetical protein DFP72DRAFT_576583 [Ephemerocybe angulata]|uniref:N-acetyltransferase domain-containing protein n=1 Tax=Ephemerocybe angulata TaxID=980116 RepID=A0A8H6HLK6_9AGAR|nr:hypothetical protein DFP72DRAFT_576583 [Tulosesus angulatus]